MWEPTAEIQEAAAPSRAIGCGLDRRKSATLRCSCGTQTRKRKRTAWKRDVKNREGKQQQQQQPGGQRGGEKHRHTERARENGKRRGRRAAGPAFIRRARPEEGLGATRHKRARKEALGRPFARSETKGALALRTRFLPSVRANASGPNVDCAWARSARSGLEGEPGRYGFSFPKCRGREGKLAGVPLRERA